MVTDTYSDIKLQVAGVSISTNKNLKTRAKKKKAQNNMTWFAFMGQHNIQATFASRKCMTVNMKTVHNSLDLNRSSQDSF